jgi:hypothetical protein
MKPTFRYSGIDLEVPENVDNNLYDPSLSEAASLDVLNGNLDYTNLEYPTTATITTSTGSIKHNKPLPLTGIRRGALFRGKMVGSTINSDYRKTFFHYRSSSSDTDGPEIEPIPGTAIEFYAPTSGLLLLTWQVSCSTDLDVMFTFSDIPQRAQRTFLTLMGATGNEFELTEIGFRHYMPQNIESSTGTFGDGYRILGTGRIWSGHHIHEVEPRTWYRYGVGIFSTANLARIRVRNFKYLFFPNGPDLDQRTSGSTEDRPPDDIFTTT